MRIAYLDCFAGIAGDMFVAALLDAGVPLHVLTGAVDALNLGASLKVETADRSGIACTRVTVFDGDTPAEPAHSHSHSHSHREPHSHPHSHDEQHAHSKQHEHDEPHAHSEPHAHPHTHGRSLSTIRTLIQSAPLAAPVRDRALQAFDLLGHSEAKIHHVPVEQIHFHEVGAVDAIVDIVAASAGIHHLAIDRWHCSPLNVGGGTVLCAHGTFPVPAPATADLLRGIPTYSAHIQKELVTPTGAALLRTLDATFGPQPPMTVSDIGYGGGTRNPKDFPNVLRLNIGIASPATGPLPGVVTVLETALDDLSPQVLAHVAESALALGALDVMLTPVIMKKGRPGTLLTVLCNEAERLTLEDLILRETTTLGIRRRQESRTVLDRRHATVATPFGDIRIKLGSRAGHRLNAVPEFEDCRAAAAQHSVPLKQVQQAAISAYLQTAQAPQP
jgi:uncharacterized protein (TIGR00299 family) protein